MSIQLSSWRWVAGALALVAGAVVAAPPEAPAEVAATQGGRAGDWPQWRGVNRDGVSLETDLLKKWPEGGPRLLWTMEGLGNGVAGVAVVGKRAYTIGGRGRDAMVMAFDLETQKEIWSTPFATASGQGERATPCVAGNRIFVMGAESTVAGLDAETGKLLWKKACRADLHGDMQHIYGYSETPLVDGEMCIFTPGAKDAAIMAVNKDTGEVIWKMPMPNFSQKGPALASYSSLVISEACGIRQYVTLLGRGLVGVEAKTGKFLWGNDKIAIQHSNIPTPLVKGDYVWGSNGYGGGTVCLKLVRDTSPDGTTMPAGSAEGAAVDGVRIKVEEQYYLKPDVCANQCGQSVMLGDYVYTGHGQYASEPMCLEWKTGKILWHDKQPGRGVAGLIAADGMLIFRAESGDVSLVTTGPQGGEVVGNFKPVSKKASGLSPPVVAGGKLYLRDGNVLMCYDLRE